MENPTGISDKLPQQSGVRYKAVLLLGAPGSGKGTQGAILKNIPGFFHFSMGDALRNIDIRSPLGKVFYDHTSRGELVPDEYVIKFWARTLDAHATLGDFKPHADLLVLDGIPRTLNQAKIMERYIEVLKVLYLVCRDENAMFERLRRRALKENRIDDADEKVIRRRMKVYESSTQPVVGNYPKEIVAEIESQGSPARVAYDILSVLSPIQDQIYTGVLG
ncbi:MAG: nucleoside monophosphate kinase [Planctomycetota bacterium]|nr:nucleoside monophosphate kinase [Planctomycetota bacterium]